MKNLATGLMLVLLGVIIGFLVFQLDPLGCNKKHETSDTATVYFPDSTLLKLYRATIDSITGESERKDVIIGRERKRAIVATGRADALDDLASSLRSDGDSLRDIIAHLDTAFVSGGISGDSVALAWRGRVRVDYSVGLDLFRDLRVEVDSMMVKFLRPVHTITNVKYEKYVAWEYVATLGGVLALLIHLILK